MTIRGEKFRDDPRIIKAKRLILETLHDLQSGLEMKASDQGNVRDYEDLLAQCSAERGGNLFFPYLGSGFGKGPLVELLDGSVKFDFICGIGVHFWGHSNAGMINAAIDGALEDIVMQGNLQQNSISQEVMHNLLLLATGSELRHCFLTSSGAMANENAFKMAFSKKPQADRVLAFNRCFAGRTLGMASVTDKAKYRIGLPETLKVDYLPFYDKNRAEESKRHMLKKLQMLLERYPDSYALMIMELIQGEGGYYEGDRDFFVELIKMLKEHGVAVLFDEVQTFGRTEKPFAFQNFGLEEYADLVTVGKMSQVCATLFKEDFKPSPGLISQTFTSSSSAIYTARYITEEMLSGDLFEGRGRNARLGKFFRNGLEALQHQYPNWLQGPYGCGAMVACTIGDGSLAIAKAFIEELFRQGCMSFIAGSNPVRVRFLPPMAVLFENDIKAVLNLIEKTLLELQKGEFL